MTESQNPRHTSPLRSGLSLIELLIAVAVIGLLLSLLWPVILSAREVARRHSCQGNLRPLGVALQAYHDTNRVLPPAAIWSTSELRSLALESSRRPDLLTCGNWVQFCLPYLDEEALAGRLNAWQLIAVPEFEGPRNERLSVMSCPSDTWNTPDNPYRLEPTGQLSLSFARGNYAMNGGSHCFRVEPGSTTDLSGDAAHLVADPETRAFQFWGNGVAGFNKTFSIDDFTNGRSTLVALEELRAGVHPVDPRGVWSLGQIGGSVTWAHGVNGDDYGPNNQRPRSDDLLGCGRLHDVVGSETLQQHRMPCVHYVDLNYQATSRSMHPGGVNVLFLDGSARFIPDDVNPGLWHAMHSRETPSALLDDGIEAALDAYASVPDAPETSRGSPPEDVEPFSIVRNSIGMEFVLLPPGEFTMGRPDKGNAYDLPEETPAHPVAISRSFLLGQYEVTRDQYARVMGASLLQSGDDPTAESGLFPAARVTWYDADEFCRRLASLPEEQSAGRRYRLPTEAEWEYACRAGSEEPYPWTERRQPDDQSGAAAGILPPLPLREVGSYPPNDFGLYDMRGNVWEWCDDWFDRTYYSRSPKHDPQGPARGFIKVVRGSDWTFIGEGCKIDYPMMPPWKSSPFVGFRLVCDVLDAPPPDPSLSQVE